MIAPQDIVRLTVAFGLGLVVAVAMWLTWLWFA